MKNLFLVLLLALSVRASTVYTGGLITGFGTQPNGQLIFYPTLGTYGTNIMTDTTHRVAFTNGAFTNLTLTGGNYEVDYLNRMLLNIFVTFGDTNNWQLTDLATNLQSYVTYGQLFAFSNNVYSAAVAAGSASAAASEIILSNSLWNLVTSSTNITLTNFSVSNAVFVVNTFYTNGPHRAFVGSTVSLAVTGTTQTPAMSLYSGDSVSNWNKTNTVQLNSASLNSNPTISPFLSTVLGPNQIFVFTNFPNSGTAALTANTSVWVSW